MRVSSQSSNIDGHFKQLPSARSASRSVEPTTIQPQNNLRVDKASTATTKATSQESGISSPLAVQPLKKHQIWCYKTCMPWSKRKPKTSPSNTTETSETFSAGPQTLDIQSLPVSELKAPSRTDISALSAKPKPPR